jgi:hypothetical protein
MSEFAVAKAGSSPVRGHPQQAAPLHSTFTSSSNSNRKRRKSSEKAAERAARKVGKLTHSRDGQKQEGRSAWFQPPGGYAEGSLLWACNHTQAGSRCCCRKHEWGKPGSDSASPIRTTDDGSIASWRTGWARRAWERFRRPARRCHAPWSAPWSERRRYLRPVHQPRERT